MILLQSPIAKMLRKKKLQLSEKVKPPKNLSISFNLTRKVYHQPLTISNRPSFLLSYVQTIKGDHWQTYSLSVGKHCSYRADKVHELKQDEQRAIGKEARGHSPLADLTQQN